MSKRLRFEKSDCTEDEYIIYNKTNEQLGIITKMRVGRFMHWCFLPDETDGYERIYFTNGCLKEVSEFITKLYSSKNTNKNNNHSPSQQTSVASREVVHIKDASDVGSNPISDISSKRGNKNNE